MTVLPTLRQLGYLVALAEHRHFGRAAEACLVTQSTLSSALQELEAALGATLVERNKRRLFLTPLGDAVVERARRLLVDARDLVDLVHQAAAEPLAGILRLGAIPTIAPFLLPQVLPRLRVGHPHLRLILREEQSRPLLDRLTAGDLDAAVIALPWREHELALQDIATDRFMFAAPPGHPLLEHPALDAEALAGAADELLLLEEGHCLRDQALAACRLTEAPGRRAGLVATSLHTLVQMVSGGLGVTLLPTMAAGLATSAGLALRTLDDPAFSRHIALAWRPTSPRHAEFRMLAELLRPSEDAPQGRA